MEGFTGKFMAKTSVLIRDEVDYVATTLKTNIREGIKDGLDAVRRTMFYILIAVGATLLGMFFLIWGLAQLLAELFQSQGIGFSVFGLLLLLIGLLCFAVSKPK